MREFLFTLTYNNLTDKKELNFIVGESGTPPTWNTVKDHATKITRAFDSDALKSRRIYFSATEKLTGISFTSSGDATMSGAVVDFSQDGKTESEITKTDAAGIMVPANSYYVFVYDKDGRLVKQQTVTTAGYPSQASDFTPQVGGNDRIIQTGSKADMGEYIWGMDGWQNSSGIYDIVKGIEVKQGEVFFLPMRVRSVSDWDLGATNNYCAGGSSQTLRIRKKETNETAVVLFSFNPSASDILTVSNTRNVFVLANSSSLFPSPLVNTEKDETFDFMYLAQVSITSGKALAYDLFEPCFDVGGLSPISANGYSDLSFTLITE